MTRVGAALPPWAAATSPRAEGLRRGPALVLALVALALGAGTAIPATAAADGDPGSDVLIYQNLFAGADDNLSTGQELQLGGLLNATTVLHAPVRVAIIGRRDDLGTVTPLWGHPAAYAQYLGTELALAYRGRLIVVMPQGVAGFWYRHGVDALTGIPGGASGDRLVAAARIAVTRLESAAGVSPTALAQAARARTTIRATVATVATASLAQASATDVSPVIVVVGLVLGFGAVFWAPPLWRRGRRLAAGAASGAVAAPGRAMAGLAVAALAGLAVAVHSGGPSRASANSLAANPYVDPGSAVTPARPAPEFTLTDETGRSVSLRRYRGKVVILAFVDDECQTICPLTTQAMVDARDSLGAAARDVQLLAVNANWRSTQVDDVLSFTELHGLLGQWHFLTGTLGQLQRVWDAYGVGADISASSSLITHTPALYIIDPQGRLREVYTTQASYGAIPQFGQVLAREASALLPDHPPVHTDYAYTPVRGISPSTPTTLPTVGGGRAELGTGRPHLYLFFASWDEQSTPIKAELKRLNAYARVARRRGLPPLTAIDEGSVEPNRTAVDRFLAGVHLDYPVAVDASGRVADGYGVSGEPWFVLADPGAPNPTPWDQEVYTDGWPTLATLAADVRGALAPARAKLSRAAAARDLAGSPAPLAALHRQASRLLPGGEPALLDRIRALRGYPIVLNLWASWCVPCQREFAWFANASAIYGRRVAFLGADDQEATASDGADFLAGHPVSYPSYAVAGGAIGDLLPGGVQGTPTTLFIGPDGRVVYRWIGQEPSEPALAQQIRAYALAG